MQFTSSTVLALWTTLSRGRTDHELIHAAMYTLEALWTRCLIIVTERLRCCCCLLLRIVLLFDDVTDTKLLFEVTHVDRCLRQLEIICLKLLWVDIWLSPRFFATMMMMVSSTDSSILCDTRNKSWIIGRASSIPINQLLLLDHPGVDTQLCGLATLLHLWLVLVSGRLHKFELIGMVMLLVHLSVFGMLLLFAQFAQFANYPIILIHI